MTKQIVKMSLKETQKVIFYSTYKSEMQISLLKVPEQRIIIDQ